MPWKHGTQSNVSCHQALKHTCCLHLLSGYTFGWHVLDIFTYLWAFQWAHATLVGIRLVSRSRMSDAMDGLGLPVCAHLKCVHFHSVTPVFSPFSQEFRGFNSDRLTFIVLLPPVTLAPENATRVTRSIPGCHFLNTQIYGFPKHHAMSIHGSLDKAAPSGDQSENTFQCPVHSGGGYKQ